jgi:hypothetical protein
MCALTYTRSPTVVAAATLDISADESLLRDIIVGYQNDDFAKQLKKPIEAGRIEGAREDNNLLYVGRRLLIPNIPQIRELFYNLAHDTLGHFGFDKSYEALRNMTHDIPRKGLIPTVGFLSRWRLVEFVRMVLGLPKMLRFCPNGSIRPFFRPNLSR